MRPSWSPTRFVKARWRLLVSAVLGRAVISFLPPDLLHVTRLLIGWDAGIALYLILIFIMILAPTRARVRRDSGRGPLCHPDPHRRRRPGEPCRHHRLAAPDARQRVGADPSRGAVLTTILSWLFVHSIFALHYAHEYYAEHRGKGGGLRFPGNTNPDYWDFVYFAFTVGTSSAVSDVEVTSRTIRKTVTAHSLVAFIFNVTMIALTVSIAAEPSNRISAYSAAVRPALPWPNRRSI